MTQMTERLVLDAPRRTAEGYLAVRAKAARTGIYDYLASEVGAPEGFKPTDTVKVWRDESEVFAVDAVRSFIGRPVTIDHPRESVTAANWREHAVGDVKAALRDGDYLAFDLVLMDAAAIDAVERGKRGLSNGYRCVLDWTPGVAPDGTRYDARQTGIRGNHVALVDAGRAGPACAIMDGERFAVCDTKPSFSGEAKGKIVNKIVLDGLQVDLADADAVAAAFAKLQDKISASDAARAEMSAKIEAMSGEKAALEKQLADARAELDPAALDRRVADRAALVALAKAIDPGVATDGVADAAIRKAVVAARIGEAAAAMTDDAIAGAFAVLAKDAREPAPNVVSIGAPKAVGDNAAVRDLARAMQF